MSTGKRTKQKFALWVMPDTMKRVEEHYKADNCSSKSEFIEKAILHYCGVIGSERNKEFLSKEILKTLKGMIDESTNRISRNLFKQAVEIGILNRHLATVRGHSEFSYSTLRKEAVEDAKRLNGSISLEEAIRQERSGGEE